MEAGGWAALGSNNLSFSGKCRTAARRPENPWFRLAPGLAMDPQISASLRRRMTMMGKRRTQASIRPNVVPEPGAHLSSSDHNAASVIASEAKRSSLLPPQRWPWIATPAMPARDDDVEVTVSIAASVEIGRAHV